jgi:Transglycosylase SLT domain
LLGFRFGKCAHRNAIRDCCFIQNAHPNDSVICKTSPRDRAPRYFGIAVRSWLAILGGLGGFTGMDAISQTACSQPLASTPAESGGEVSIAQVPAGLTLRRTGHRPVVATDHPQPERSSALTKMAEQAAIAHTLPTAYFLRLIRQESGFNPNSVSPTGAQGIAQFMPATAADRGLQDPFDPAQALPKSAELLDELRNKFGNLGLAAAAYNAGTDRVHKWLAGKSLLPQETIDYVRVITGHDGADWAKSNDLALIQNFDGPGTSSRARRPFWEAQLLATLQASSADASPATSATTAPIKAGNRTGEASVCPGCILQSGY